MNDCHSDKNLDTFAGKHVRITLRNGKQKDGILQTHNDGEYQLLQMNGVFCFYKSHVKKIELICGSISRQQA